MTKVISLSNAAYETLRGLKKEGESFSDAVMRISACAPKRGKLMDLFGKWPGPKEELDRIEREIYQDRKKATIREVSFE